MKKIFFMFALTACVIVGCEEKEDDQVNKAQKCLNEATVPADATACKAMIEGINNKKANQVRCAIVVLENGVTQQRIVNAFAAMDSATQDPVVEVATQLGLGDRNSDTNVDSYETDIAEYIKDTCYASDSLGMKTVAQIILFGTKAQAATGGDFTDPDDVAADINNMTDQDAGEFANDVFDLYCVPTYSNNDICGTLSGAGAGSADAATVGQALKLCLKNNNCT